MRIVGIVIGQQFYSIKVSTSLFDFLANSHPSILEEWKKEVVHAAETRAAMHGASIGSAFKSTYGSIMTSFNWHNTDKGFEWWRAVSHKYVAFVHGKKVVDGRQFKEVV